MPDSRGRALLLIGAGVTAAAGFALIARAVARRKTVPLDHQVLVQTHVGRGHPARRAAEAIEPVGKWWTYVPVAVLSGAYVVASRHGDRSPIAGMAAIVGTATAAAALSNLFDDVLPQPTAPPGRRSPNHPVFPSGHAFGTASVALAAAYVLTREGAARPSLVIPLAMAVPIAASIGRMAEGKHWLSDVAGAHLAAITLASFALAAYEATSS